MERQNIPVNSVRLCFDHCDEEGMDGRIIGVALRETILFSDVRDFLKKVDRAFDQIGRPQPYHIPRSFKETEQKSKPFTANPPRYHDAEAILSQVGDVLTVDLIMLSRQHSEWQGVLKDVRGEVIGRFSSALACVQLMIR